VTTARETLVPKRDGNVGARLKVFANGVPHVFQSFLAGGALAAAAGKIIAQTANPSPGLDQRYRVIHGSSVEPVVAILFKPPITSPGAAASGSPGAGCVNFLALDLGR